MWSDLPKVSTYAHNGKQVDILISKNQVLEYYTLNIKCIKLKKIIMDKKLAKCMKVWSLRNEQTYIYPTLKLL